MAQARAFPRLWCPVSSFLEMARSAGLAATRKRRGVASELAKVPSAQWARLDSNQGPTDYEPMGFILTDTAQLLSGASDAVSEI